MRTRRHRETPARHALWVGGLLVVLAGLLGMHGLDSHGAVGMDTIPQAVVTETAHLTTATGVVGPVADDVTSMTHGLLSVTATVTASPAHDAMDMGMAEMCVAILAAALIALLRLLLRAQTRPVLWLLARPARAPAQSGRDADPPSLIKLSIQRC